MQGALWWRWQTLAASRHCRGGAAVAHGAVACPQKRRFPSGGSAQSGSASGAESGVAVVLVEAARSTVRARQKSRRRDGVAADRPASWCRQTQRASGDGPESSHGEKGVGDNQSQRHRQSPDRPGHEAQPPKNGGRKTYAQGDIEGTPNALFAPRRRRSAGDPGRRAACRAAPGGLQSSFSR